MVDSECDDNDQSQDEAQDKRQSLLKTLPLVRDALVGCKETKGRKRSQSPVSDGADCVGGSGDGVRDGERPDGGSASSGGDIIGMPDGNGSGGSGGNGTDVMMIVAMAAVLVIGLMVVEVILGLMVGVSICGGGTGVSSAGNWPDSRGSAYWGPKQSNPSTEEEVCRQ